MCICTHGPQMMVANLSLNVGVSKRQCINPRVHPHTYLWYMTPCMLCKQRKSKKHCHDK